MSRMKHVAVVLAAFTMIGAASCREPFRLGREHEDGGQAGDGAWRPGQPVDDEAPVQGRVHLRRRTQRRRLDARPRRRAPGGAEILRWARSDHVQRGRARRTPVRPGHHPAG